MGRFRKLLVSSDPGRNRGKPKSTNIAAPTGGVTVDAQARTAINAILELLADKELMEEA